MSAQKVVGFPTTDYVYPSTLNPRDFNKPRVNQLLIVDATGGCNLRFEESLRGLVTSSELMCGDNGYNAR